MALHTQIGSEIPKDAVLLSSEDALAYQKNLVATWKYGGDVFFLRYGSTILSCAAALSGMYINSYYRFKMRLQSFARLSTYGPAVVIPSVAALILHNKRVLDPLLIEQYPCPVCLEIKAVVMQVTASMGYPLALAPLSSFMMAERYSTYNIPSLSRQPKALLKLFKKITLPMATTFIGLSVLQAVIAAFVTFKEGRNLITIKEKLILVEKEFEERRVKSKQF